MIDKIRLRRRLDLDTSRFNTRKFTYDTYDSDGTEYHYYRYNNAGVNISYSTRSNTLYVEGRLINLSRAANRVDTLDVLWAGIPGTNEMPMHDIDTVLNMLNNTLLELTGYRIDIRRFEVSYIEICFNIHTEHVGSYLYQFNDIYRLSDKARYKNYIIAAKKDWHTGFYIKTAKDYALNKKDNYVINFYDKHHQLVKMRDENREDEYGAAVTQNDIERSRNILRLELQCGYNFLRQIKDNHGIRGVLQDFLDIDFCSEILKQKYIFFIDRYEHSNFHTYDSVISLINQSSLSIKEKKALRDYARLLATRAYKSKSKSTRAKYEGMLANLQIHHVLIHSRAMNCKVSLLQAPMALLDEHVDFMKRQRENFMEQYNLSDCAETYQEDISIDSIEISTDDMQEIFE